LTISLDSEKTLVLYGPENAISVIKQFYARVQSVSNLITDPSGPQAIIQIKEYSEVLRSLIDRGVKRRLITEITRDNLQYCKQLASLVELRHLEGVKGNFAVSETEYMATAILYKTEPITQIIYSNAGAVVEQHRYLFDTLWTKAIPAQQKILQIEEGVEADFFEVITDQKEASELLVTLSKSARKEVLFLLPNDKAIIRIERLGVLDTLAEGSERGVRVRVICPITNINSHIVERLRKESKIEFASGDEAQSGILITDSSRFVSAELVDPASESFSEAIGTALYSNSKRTINLLRSFFDSLWNQVELYKRLELQEKLEKEFVNIAAHELRTPVQPILGMTEIIESMSEDTKMIQVAREDLAIIRRNAIRLEQLTSDILDIARIESGSLHLQKENCSLDDIIIQAINDIQNQAVYGNDKQNATIDYQPVDLTIYADKRRLSEVLCNLIDNAIKFTKDGQITISAETKNGETIVSVKDTGTGIDKEIIPRLFSKFATKSERGTGLGLFITKSLVEAHGGKIWAENNKDGKGATFTFTLPLIF
jgi:signal transduction histidine kinase